MRSLPIEPANPALPHLNISMRSRPFRLKLFPPPTLHTLRTQLCSRLGRLLAAFVLGVGFLMMPGWQVLPEDSFGQFLLAPFYFLGLVHGVMLYLVAIAVGSLLRLPGACWRLWLKLQQGETLTIQFSLADLWQLGLFLLFVLFIGLWFWLLWEAFLVGIGWWRRGRKKFSTKQSASFNVGLIPLLGILLSFLWASHLPLSFSFALHQSAFEQLIEPVATGQQESLEFSPAKQVGMFAIAGIFPLTPPNTTLPDATPTAVSLVMDPQRGLWAYTGFVCELSDAGSNLVSPPQVSFAPGSNVGDQTVLPLATRWYAFQNLFD